MNKANKAWFEQQLAEFTNTAAGADLIATVRAAIVVAIGAGAEHWQIRLAVDGQMEELFHAHDFREWSEGRSFLAPEWMEMEQLRRQGFPKIDSDGAAG